MRLYAPSSPVNADCPPLVSLVVFDPWPFEHSSVDLGSDVAYIDSSGEINPACDGPYNLNQYDNCLAYTANGKTFVTTPDGAIQYAQINSHPTLITVKDTHS